MPMWSPSNIRALETTNVMPSHSGIVEDSLAVYRWVKQSVPKLRIIVGGRSLGTGIVMQLAEVFTETNGNPSGVVLEAPFNSLVEAAMRWPSGLPFRYLPLFRRLALPLQNQDTNFESEQKAGKLSALALVMHSKDDFFIPCDLDQKVLSRTRAERPPKLPPPVFHEVHNSVGPGHQRIHKDPRFLSVVSAFICSVV
ncbi:hypothetical protein HPB50_005349 [Hyalomma asiaticum]|uniref:Uncharacterized protein n=1 Tax=Hyalomma asiaticum TaxID=266040 RepID=A0ACB7SRR0_HYAAI|nr:hypothetical protein HPB50_005349 [Hyalomma asiaticum]